MTKKLILFSLLLSSILAQAQYPPLSWAKKIQAVDNINSQCAFTIKTADEQGNLYGYGYFRDSVRPDQNLPNYYLTGNNNWDSGIFGKYDAAGNLIWSNKIVSLHGYFYVTDMSIDQDHNVYVLCNGVYADTIDFDSSPGNSNTISDGNDFFFAKYDPSGSLLWVKLLNVANSTNAFTNLPNSITVDSSKNIYIAGQIQAKIDIDPGAATVNLVNPFGINCNCTAGFYAKYDSLGNLIWSRVDGDNSGINSIDVNPINGNIIIGGNPSQFSGYPLRLCDASGNLLKSLYGSRIYVNVAKFDTIGNIYFSGYYSSSGNDFDWSNSSFNLSTSATYETVGFIAKYDASQTFQWATPFEATTNSSFRTRTCNLSLGADQNPILSYVESNGNSQLKGFVKIDEATGNNLSPISTFDALVGLNGAYAIPSDFDGSIVFSAGVGFSGNAAFTYNASADPGAIVNLPGKGYWSVMSKYGDCSTAPAIPGAISGTSVLCGSAVQTYSVPLQLGVGSYSWTLPNGWTGSSTSNTINATPGLSGGIISVIATNLCGSSLSQTLNVSVSTTPNVTINDTTICSGQTALLAAYGADTYSWSAGVTNANGNTANASPLNTSSYTVTGTTAACSATATVTVNVNPLFVDSVSAAICQGATYIFPDSSSSAIATVHTSHFSSSFTCDSAIVTTLSINTLPQISLNFTSIDTLCLNQGIISLSNAIPSGGLFSGVGISGSNFNTTAAGVGTHEIIYLYTDSNSCANQDTATIYIDACTGLQSPDAGFEFSIYPNPTSGNFSINFASFENTILSITDLLGQEILNEYLVRDVTNFQIIEKGIYLVYLKTQESISIKKLLVN